MSQRDSIHVNQASWTKAAAQYADWQRDNYAQDPEWGLWGIPETEVGLIPDVAGKDTIEIGCGTAYVSAWLSKLGGHPMGVDPTPAQLATARSFQDKFDIHFPLIRAAGEQLPFADASFDFAISEYGAAIWADPYKWVPEAARVLRPGGELSFLVNSTISILCAPDSEDEMLVTELIRPQFGLHRIDWEADDGVNYYLSHGDWIKLLRSHGFEILDLIELQPAEGATTNYEWAKIEWARQWPMEEAWKVRKIGS